MYENVVVIGATQLAYRSLNIINNNMKEGKVSIIDTSKTSKEDAMEILCNQICNTLVLSIMNPYIIPEDVIDHANLTIVNVHHALLPGHRGRNAQSWALYYNEAETGITWHFVDKGIDTGKIIKCYPIKINATDTSISLLKKQNDLILESLDQSIEGFLRGNYFSEQPKQRNSFFHLNSEIPNNGELDLNWDGAQISRFLRTMDFGPYRLFGFPFLFRNDHKMEIHKYQIHESTDIKEDIMVTGNIVEINKNGYRFILKTKIQ